MTDRSTAVDAVVMTSAMTPVEGELLTEYAEIDLPLAELPTKDQLTADTESANRFVASRAKMLLKQLEAAPLSQTYPYPVSCWKLGNDLQFISLGGEVVLDQLRHARAARDHVDQGDVRNAHQ